jgi:carbonic anhydrase
MDAIENQMYAGRIIMNGRPVLVVLLTFALAILSCQAVQDEGTKEMRVSSVLTADLQAKLTPQAVLNDLKQGNKRFAGDRLTRRDYVAQAEKTAKGQFPKAAILSCLDSRVPVEIVFDQGIGDVFVGRVAGNVVDDEMLGSIEFACKVAGSKLVVLLGHESCGAVKGAIDDVKIGNLKTLLARLKPAVERSQDFSGEKSSKNADFVALVTKNNVLHNIDLMREKSPVLREMEEKGQIMIVGALYDLDSGVVTFLN